MASRFESEGGWLKCPGEWSPSTSSGQALWDEYREVLSRLDILEHDVSDIKVDLRDLRREMNERFDQMYDRMLVQTRWLIGSLALIGTVVSVLLAIGQFVK